MACTNQSAVEYIRNATAQLVQKLRDLSVIVDSLCKIHVFCDEEVSEIQSEKTDFARARSLLLRVTKKGERACYELLKIIYIARKRNSERPVKNVASTKTSEFDLDHWISCFSFTEDPLMDTSCYYKGPKLCHKYRERLKGEAEKVSAAFWKSNQKLFAGRRKPHLSYAPLVLDTQGRVSLSKIKKLKSKKMKMDRMKKMKSYLPVDKSSTGQTVSLDDLLSTRRNVLVVGKPGIGKTALAHQLLKLWSEKDDDKLDYMFYFDFRQTDRMRDVSLEDLLFGLFCEPAEGKEEVLQDLKKNSDSVTVIIDGVTDPSSSVVWSIVDKCLPDAKVIVTCRVEDEEDFDEDFFRVEVKGFNEQTIKTYFHAALGEDHEKVVDHVELLSLCHVPVYALMVAVCFSSERSTDCQDLCTLTDIYINIVRFCLQRNSNIRTRDLNQFISTKREGLLSLAEAAFNATEAKTVSLTELPVLHEDHCVLSFLKQLHVRVAPTETSTMFAFLHYTMQEFFAALWLLKNPDKLEAVIQQSLTEEMRHMQHVIPFTCRLLAEKKPTLMKWLLPAEQLQETSGRFFTQMMSCFYNVEDGLQVDLLFLCQCLFESQRPEACVSLLDQLDYDLDLRGEKLDPSSCCAVAYVISQSKGRKVRLNLEKTEVSEHGAGRLFGCLQHVQWSDRLAQQLWKLLLLSPGQVDHRSLLHYDGHMLRLPVVGEVQLFERAVKVLQESTRPVQVCLYWEPSAAPCPGLNKSLLEALPWISSLSFRIQDQEQDHRRLEEEKQELLLALCLTAALHNEGNFDHVGKKLFSMFSLRIDFTDFLFDFYQRLKSEGHSSIIPSLRSFFQSTLSVWTINLSERKSSILLEVLQLQSEKKQVKLRGCSVEESEVKSFLQCLPHISQLSFWIHPWSTDPVSVQLCVNVFRAAAAEGEETLELLASVCRYKTFPLHSGTHYGDDHWDQHQLDFLLDLYCGLKDCKSKRGLSVLPSLRSVLQSTPSVWTIKLSQRKISILLEVLQLQSEKKQVKLIDCSVEESEVKSFLQCLPHISQLSFYPWYKDSVQFCVKVFRAAAAEGEETLELLASVCRHKTFPLHSGTDYGDEYHSDFVLDLYCGLKDCESETGLSVLPSLRSVLQSTPSVWTIDLSERKSSILLEVLQLQSEKKQVKLIGCSVEESEVKSFLQCLPHISQLSFSFNPWYKDSVQFCVKVFRAAAAEGEETLELLASVCRYKTFPLHSRTHYDDIYQSDFLLDLYCGLKDCESETGLSVLPSLRSVLQSTPSVWTIDLSKRKISILLEVLQLQSEKKQVKLIGCSVEESEVKSFLQCLPHISQLSFWDDMDSVQLCVNVFRAAAAEGEETLELLASVCRYKTFPLHSGTHYGDDDDDDHWDEYQLDFLLDLYCGLKDCESERGLSVLPSLRSVLQSTPSVWFIDLSKRKISILLEVLQLQSEKKQVKLVLNSGFFRISDADRESEVKNFFQCLPHICELSFSHRWPLSESVRVLVALFCAAAERQQLTGQKTLELLVSVCRPGSFPDRDFDDFDKLETDHRSLLQSLCSRVKDCERRTGLSVLPLLNLVLRRPLFPELHDDWHKEAFLASFAPWLNHYQFF
ncbi:uncharacterized protein V6R79_005571 [Siganus canaliculatus]